LSSIGPNQNVTVGGHRLGHNIAVVGDVVAKGSQSGTASVVFFSTTNAPSSTSVVHFMFKATPSVAILPLSGANLVAGINDVYKFSVTANGGDIGLYKFTFGLTTTTARITSVELVDATETNQVSLYSASTVSNASNELYVEAYFDTDSSGSGASNGEERTVAQGTTRIFILKATVASVASGSSVQAQLAGDAALPSANGQGTTYVMASAMAVDTDGNDDFTWSDASVTGNHATSTNDWINGYLVAGLSSSSSTQSSVGVSN
jgi:hypothetical protein